MTREFTDGAEMGDLLFFDGGASMTATSATARSGTYSYSNSSQAGTRLLSSAISEFYFRVAFRMNNAGLAANFFQWRSGTTTLGSLRTTGDGRFAFFVGNTQVTTSTAGYLTNTWYLLEGHVKIADSGGQFELKIDGVLDAGSSYSGDTKPGTPSSIDNLVFGGVNGGTLWFDDIALNTTAGAEDNSWCGDGRIIYMAPNDNGDSSDWVGSDADSTDNYALVDEIPPNSADYVESDTLDDLDLYALAASGLDASDLILRVWPEARAIDTVADGGEIALTVKTESTEYDSDDIPLITTYGNRVIGGDYLVNPNTSIAWTATQLDALQVGPKNRS